MVCDTPPERSARGPGNLLGEAAVNGIGGIFLQESGNLHARVLHQLLAVQVDVQFVVDHGRIRQYPAAWPSLRLSLAPKYTPDCRSRMIA